MEINLSSLRDFLGGWVVGNFDPALVRSESIEVAVKTFRKGDTESEHYQLSATEFTLVVEGECLLGSLRLSKGEIAEIPPNVSCSFIALSDVTVVVVKTPSLPNDKINGKGPISYG